jgi:hypothetical protein
VSDVARGVVAAATASAAIVHFAYAPTHFDHNTSHGAFFAVVGWTQLLLAGALAFRLPHPRRWLTATAVVNAAIVGVWIVSRTVGVPGESEAEAVGFPDVLATILEAAAILGALAILLHLLADRPVQARPTFAFAGVSALATMLLVSLSIAPSVAGSHTHGDDEHAHSHGDSDAGHDHGTEGEMADAAHEHDDMEEGSDGHSHDTGDGHEDHDGHDTTTTTTHDGHDHGTTTTTHDGHDHGTTTTTGHDHSTTTTTHGGHDHGTTTTTGHDHGTTTTTHGHGEPTDDWAATRLAALTGHLPPEKIAEFREKSIEHLSGLLRERSNLLRDLPEAERESRISTFVTWSVDNTLEAENGHSHGPKPWVPITDPAEQLALQQQLTAAASVIPKYPTAADAMAAGYVQVTPYVPGIAAHYLNFRLTDRTFDPGKPEFLLYNGNRTTSRLVGVSYAMFGAQPGPTDGFVGSNDEWHEHPSLCVLGVMVVGPDHTPDDLCNSVGAGKLRGNPLWMMHIWQVPGFESAWGLFSGENPSINMATSDVMNP